MDWHNMTPEQQKQAAQMTQKMQAEMNQPPRLQALGVAKTSYSYGPADAALLERFANPLTGPGRRHVQIESPEFTSLCPITGQPDFAKIVVVYTPRNWCVESKAWKLYLGSFRNDRHFHEACVEKITTDLIQFLDPDYLLVRGEFTPRGGIPFWPEREYYRPNTAVKVRGMPTTDELKALLDKEVVNQLVVQSEGGTWLAYYSNGTPRLMHLNA